MNLCTGEEPCEMCEWVSVIIIKKYRFYPLKGNHNLIQCGDHPFQSLDNGKIKIYFSTALLSLCVNNYSIYDFLTLSQKQMFKATEMSY